MVLLCFVTKSAVSECLCTYITYVWPVTHIFCIHMPVCASTRPVPGWCWRLAHNGMFIGLHKTLHKQSQPYSRMGHVIGSINASKRPFSQSSKKNIPIFFQFQFNSMIKKIAIYQFPRKKDQILTFLDVTIIFSPISTSTILSFFQL